jgi:type IV secretory pathway VirB2 component (pilin)
MAGSLRKQSWLRFVAQSRKGIMGRQAATVLYVLTMVVVVVGVDVLFFRNQFWERLMANVGIVLVFGAFYLSFLKHS